MKKKLSAFLAMVLSCVCISAPLGVNAESALNIENENFNYEALLGSAKKFTMLNDVLQPSEGERITVVTGVYDRCYMLTELNSSDYTSSTLMYFEKIAPFIGDRQLHLGDVVSLKNWDVLMTLPSKYGQHGTEEHLSEDGTIVKVEYPSEVNYLGFGTDIFGEEFLTVIRHEMADNIKKYSSLGWNSNEPFESLIVKGDMTEDENVSIVDALATNQYLLGIHKPSNYGILAADVNHDGSVTDADSLMILKSLVGLETLE
ncbi:MAG: dockerin type I repeat-containing protein [Oscillospiraceae bacterium]